MELKARTSIRIQRPVSEVFNAVVDPRKLEGFFVSSASAPLRSDTTVQWAWSDQNAKADVQVARVEQNRSIVLHWEAGGRRTEITLSFTDEGSSTKVSVMEDGWPKDDKGIAALAENTQGWTNFMDCLKAYVEHGINLRQGAY